MMLKALVCGECISAIRRGALEGPLVGVTTIEMRFQVRDAFSAMRAVLSRDLRVIGRYDSWYKINSIDSFRFDVADFLP